VNGLAARSGALIASYVAASAAAAVFYTLLIVVSAQIIGVEQPSEMPFGQQMQMLVWFAILVGTFVLTLAAVPSAIALVALKLLGLKDIFSHIVAGVAVSAVAVTLAARYVMLLDRMNFDWAVALSGAAGGTAFWAMHRKLTMNERSA
jgi:hypothetical protein